jgi:hypothetical protein
MKRNPSTIVRIKKKEIMAIKKYLLHKAIVNVFISFTFERPLMYPNINERNHSRASNVEKTVPPPIQRGGGIHSDSKLFEILNYTTDLLFSNVSFWFLRNVCGENKSSGVKMDGDLQLRFPSEGGKHVVHKAIPQF